MNTNTNVGSTSRILAIAFYAFGVTLLILNAGLTAQFGWVYGGSIFAAIFLALNFDVAGLAWYTARLQSGLSGTQRAIAKIMSLTTIVSSIIVSLIMVLMTFTLVDLSAYHTTIGTAGTWLVSVVCGMNSFALFFFQFASPAEQKIELQEELSAQTTDQVNEMTKEAHAKAMNRARTVLMGKTNIIGDRIAQDVEREFLRSMNSLDLLDDGSTPPPPPPPPAVSVVGAAAGAKKVKKSKGKKKAKLSASLLPLEESEGSCKCGLRIGEGADECTGYDCTIDTGAATAKATREDHTAWLEKEAGYASKGTTSTLEMEPLDFTAGYSLRTPAEIELAEAEAAERRGK